MHRKSFGRCLLCDFVVRGTGRVFSQTIGAFSVERVALQDAHGLSNTLEKYDAASQVNQSASCYRPLKELFEMVQGAFGMIPNTVRVMANSPAVLEESGVQHGHGKGSDWREAP